MMEDLVDRKTIRRVEVYFVVTIERAATMTFRDQDGSEIVPEDVEAFVAAGVLENRLPLTFTEVDRSVLDADLGLVGELDPRRCGRSIAVDAATDLRGDRSKKGKSYEDGGMGVHRPFGGCWGRLEMDGTG